MKLVTSYHGIYDADDFNRNRAQIAELYERAALPIEKGGMALRNVALIALTSFTCSLAASLTDLANVFPDWIELRRGGAIVRVLEEKSPGFAAQVVDAATQYRRLTPEGDFSCYYQNYREH